MLQFTITIVLVVLAVGVLLAAWLGGRSRRDPSTSVADFHRALDAMGRQGGDPVDGPDADTPADVDTPASR